MASTLPGRPVVWRPHGLSDARDGTNAFPGAMSVLQNLIPDPTTPGQWVPRPAAFTLPGTVTNPTVWGSFNWGAAPWGGFDNVSGPAQINALLIVGNLIYGMIASTSGPNAGRDVPFVYNKLTQGFSPIAIPGGAASLPVTPAASGDWTPPTMDQIAGRVVITHPGYPGGNGPYFGWLDISGFSSTSLTGTTHSTTTIDSLSGNPLTAGVQPGMTIAGAGIQPNTSVVTVTATTITLSLPATSSGSGVALTIAGGTTSQPVYGSGNTNTQPLPAVPVAVSEFNARAYFAVPGNGALFSDAGSPCQRTNSTQGISPQNGVDITAFGGLPVTQTQGGILQALIAFQGNTGMQQITGDPAFSPANLSINGLGVGVGTLAPNTICQTPLGLAFVAPDGLRYIDLLARVSDPIGASGQGVQAPFLNAVNPTRMAAAYNQDVIRITVQNGAINGQPLQEYWYHVSRRCWSGPHTFPAALIQPSQLDDNDFVMVAPAINAALWHSDVTPNPNSSYTENGTPLAWKEQTVLLPDNEELSENAVVETTMALAIPPGNSVQVTAQNEAGVQLGTVTVFGPPGTAPLWGTLVWGQGVWGGQTGYLAQYDAAWSKALVFKQMALVANGASINGLGVGNIYFRYEPLNYRMQAMQGVAVAGGAR